MSNIQTIYPEKVDQTHYDLIIIGGGASGISAATRTSDLDTSINILLINAGLSIGGTCVNVGCVPSKVLIEMANNYYYSQFPHYDSILGKCVCISDADFAKSVKEKDEMVAMLRNQNYKVPLQDMKNVTVIHGYAKFLSSEQIEVNDRKYTGEKFLISTGSSPNIPPIAGIDKVDYLTSKDALSLDDIPKSLIVIGAGPTGLELAQMFHHFGSDVIVLEAQDQVIPGTEKEISEELFDALKDEEIPIYLNCRINKVEKNGDRIIAFCTIDGDEKNFAGHKLLVTTGVKPNTDGLNLEKAGVTVDKKGYIQTNEMLQTDMPNIWAAGDVVGNALLETIAAKEGYLAAGYMFFDETSKIDYKNIPRAVFTTPNLAVVGLTEKEAQTKNNNIESRTIEYTRIPKAVALKETRGKIKMVVDAETRKILGIHMVAHNAAEFVTEASMILKYGLTIEDVIDTVHVFPTMSEGIKKVAQAFIRDVSRMACCVE